MENLISHSRWFEIICRFAAPVSMIIGVNFWLMPALPAPRATGKT